MISDKLFNAVKTKGMVCVGLDTAIDYLPTAFRNQFANNGDGLFAFNKAIIDATQDVCACYKVQIAYYEAEGINGLNAYIKTLKYLAEKGLISIGDIKRGDIKDTASMYAKAHFAGDFACDMVTLNPYMGLDSLEPYLNYVENEEKGLFVLVRTSNEGAKDVQYLETKENKHVYNIVGEKLQELGANKRFMGSCGYSSIGGVVGCTHAEEAAEVRQKLSSMFFLIPGYGAQGGAAADVAPYTKDGNGAVVNSSRAILLAWKKEGTEDFATAARNEAIKMRDALREACK